PPAIAATRLKRRRLAADGSSADQERSRANGDAVVGAVEVSSTPPGTTNEATSSIDGLPMVEAGAVASKVRESFAAEPIAQTFERGLSRIASASCEVPGIRSFGW